MRFPPQFLDELRTRLPVSEVAGKRVRLKKQGREWRGLSPFNQEKTPSFYVNDQKGFFHDFSSGKHGDIFDFLRETEGLTFPEAVERCASLAGLQMPKMSREAEAQAIRRRTLYEVMALAARFFEASLAARAGARARGYLADRGLDAATQVRFGIGYAPADRFALKEHLGGQGVPVEDMVEAGLLIAANGSDIPLPYDRFRDRVMFPIADLTGRIVAFGGRALDKDVSAKYLNSPETPLFHKGSTLYNGANARKAAHLGAPVIAVEGYVDVIAMVTAGYEATVAPLGTALTTDQLALLWKMADEPVLCFDGDGAGHRAAFRVADLALPLVKPGKSLRFASLPEGHDPDDLVRSGGPGAVAEVLATARPLADVLWTREVETGRFDTPERRAGFEARINELMNAIADETVRRHYRQDFWQRLRNLTAAAGSPPRPARGNFQPGAPAGRNSRNGNAKHARRGRGFETTPLVAGSLAPLSPQLQASPLVRGARNALPRREALILLAAFNHPWLLETEAEQLAGVEFQNGDADMLRRVMLDITATGHRDQPPDSAELRQSVVAGKCGAALRRLEEAFADLADWPARAGAAPEDVRQWWTHVLTLHHRNRTLNKDLKDAERALGEEPSERNLAWLLDIKSQLSSLEGTEASIEGFGALSGRPSGGGP
jgi:DNA primase